MLKRFLPLLALFFAFGTPSALAEFSLSGTTITQSGTDADLSGLQAISGVEYTTYENFTHYYTDSLNMVVTGELTIDPTYEKLTFGANAPTPNLHVNGGTLNLGVKSTVNAETIYTYGTALEFLKTSDSDYWQVVTKGGLFLSNGATFNAYGAKIISRLSVGWGSINNLQELYGDIEKLEIEMLDPANSQIRFDIAPGFESGVKLYNGFVITSQTPTPDITFSGSFIEHFSPTLKNGRITPTNTQEHRLIFRDMVVGGNAGEHDIYSGYIDTAANPYMDFYNLDVGTSASVRESYTPFLFSFYKDVNAGVKDINESAVQDALVYIQNTNGTVFSGTTNASGTLDKPLTVLYAELVEGNQGTMWRRYTKGNSASDYNNNDNDVLDIQFASYHHLLSQLEISMKEVGTLEVGNLLFADPAITESDAAVVAAYTQLDTPAKLYDYAKQWLVNNYSGQNQTLVSLEGDTLTSDFSITLDPNAAAVFAFDGTQITVKASQFTGNIEANSITTLSGARVLGLRNGVFYAQDGDIISTEYAKVIADQDMSIVVDGVTLPEVEVLGGATLNISGINNAKQPTTITQTSGTILIDDDLVPSANYTETAGVLTMSGTETDLTGMRGLPGVSYSTSAGVTTYSIGNVLLQINGELTIGSNEKIEYGDAPPGVFLQIGSAGKLTIYGTNDGSTTTENIANPQIISELQSTNHWSTNHGILVEGTLDLSGGMIDIASHINFQTGSTFRTRGGVVKMSDAANGYPNLLRWATATGGATIDIQDFVLYQGSNAFELPDITINALKNYSPRNCKEGIMKKAAVASPLVLSNYNPENCEIDTSYIGTGSFYVIYGMADKAPTATVHFDHSIASGGGITEVRKVVNFEITDGDTGTAVENAAIFAKDSVHPTTRDYSDAFYVSLISGQQILTQHEYTATTNASGQASIDKLLAYAGVFPNENVGAGSAAREVLYKTKAADHSYADDFFVFSYAHLPATIGNVDLTGLGEAEVDWLLFGDPSIAQADDAVVAAYSQLDTPEKLYDYAKKWLVDNYSGETGTLVRREGDTLLSDFNITLDAAAAQTFAFDGDTITIRAINFDGNLTLPTSKSVTLQNGATVAGGVIDSAGDSFLSFSGVDGWEVFADEARTTSLGTGTENEKFRFVFTGGEIFYANLQLGADNFQTVATPTQSGETVVELSDTALLKSISEQVAALPSATDIVAEVEREDGLLMRIFGFLLDLF